MRQVGANLRPDLRGTLQTIVRFYAPLADAMSELTPEQKRLIRERCPVLMEAVLLFGRIWDELRSVS